MPGGVRGTPSEIGPDPDCSTVGVPSFLGERSAAIDGKPFTYCKEIICVGMSIAQGGLRRRLRSLDAALSNQMHGDEESDCIAEHLEKFDALPQYNSIIGKYAY
jgi:hypothetical protein